MFNSYVLCGIPGSGKTTLAKQLSERNGAVLHSVDDIPNAWGDPDIDGKFRNQWIDNIKTDLQNGNGVVCDSTALTSFDRKWLLNELSDFDCKKILMVKAVPIEECLRRNANRDRKVPEEQIRLSAYLLEAPTEDEGWDEIYVCRE